MHGSAPQHILAIATSAVFALALLDAARTDWHSFRIPNRIPLLLLAAFPPVALLEGFTLTQWLTHAGVGLALFALGALLFFLRAWGGGDAKLVPAVGLWVGAAGLPRFLLVMTLIGGLLAMLSLLLRVAPAGLVGGNSAWRGRLLASRQIPYGVAIAAAGLDWWVSAL
ncbi:MAG TPA: prepilin peptidase [Magnetospirillaceae bacterium]|nr:prepilin peptidase [Magnetospirillaceae bacterium]